jgi:hypothetical protein
VLEVNVERDSVTPLLLECLFRIAARDGDRVLVRD